VWTFAPRSWAPHSSGPSTHHHNDGCTLPVALDLGTDVAVRRRRDGLLRTVARRLDATDTRPIDALRPAEGPRSCALSIISPPSACP
jgi:hypothetical protein